MNDDTRQPDPRDKAQHRMMQRAVRDRVRDAERRAVKGFEYADLEIQEVRP